MKINIIGAGRVGQTLGRLFLEKKTFIIGSVLSRSLSKSTEAVSFIGAGSPVNHLNAMEQADVYMVTVADNALGAIGHEMLEHHEFKKGSVIFHCSGVTPSTIFDNARSRGCLIASVHPVKSFADPSIAVGNFEGTFCGVEGDEEALCLLDECFRSIGGEMFRISTNKKAMYHAATVMACNNLIALIETAASMYIDSGLSRNSAFHIMEPIVRGTITNIFKLGTVDALTGPIARGDSETIVKHILALKDDNGMISDVYSSLGKWALLLSREQHSAPSEALEDIQNHLNMISQKTN